MMQAANSRSDRDVQRNLGGDLPPPATNKDYISKMWNLIDSHPSALQSKKKVASIQFQDSGQARLSCMCGFQKHATSRQDLHMLFCLYNDKMIVRTDTDMGNWTRGWGEGGMDDSNFKDTDGRCHINAT